jgi:hypothetical protein
MRIHQKPGYASSLSGCDEMRCCCSEFISIQLGYF